MEVLLCSRRHLNGDYVATMDNSLLTEPDIEVHTAWCGFHTTLPAGCRTNDSIDIISHRDKDKGIVIVSIMNTYNKQTELCGSGL